MKHTRKASKAARRVIALLAAVVLVVTGIRPTTVNAMTANTAVESVNFRDFSNWRSGNYHYITGLYTANSARLCLQDHVIVRSGEYKVQVNNSNYHLLIREYDANKKMINSYDLVNGKAYITSVNAVYLGISIYNAKSESGITYATYSQLFANGFYAGLEAVGSTSTTTPSDSNDSENNDKNSTVIENKVYDVIEIDFNDFSNWRSGLYHWTSGKYCTYPSRLSLDDYVTVDGGAYTVRVKNTAYHLLVRELDQNKAIINSCDLANGESFTPKADTAYLGISIYKTSGESSVSYDTYKKLFAGGFYAGLEAVSSEKDNTTNPQDGNDTGSGKTDDTAVMENQKYDVTGIDFKDVSNWRSGLYHWTSGKYCTYPSRLSLNDYVTVDGGTYTVCVKNTAYHLLVRELDRNKVIINSCDLANGKTFVPKEDTAYLGISIYKVSGESSVSYDTYKKLFAGGFYAGLEAVEEEEAADSDNNVDNTENNAEVNADSQAVYNLLERALLQSDASQFDISKYKLTADEVENAIWKKVVDDNYMEYIAHGNIQLYVTEKSGYAYTVRILNISSSGYESRLTKVKEAVNNYLAQIDNKMTDVDKVLLAHEYVLDITQYKASGSTSYVAAGPLAEGYGVCSGYSDAMIALLHCVDIEAYTVVGVGMNHGWLYVKLDGQYYHIDATWDDTQKGTNDIYQHRFLLRSDKEFETISAARVHSNWCSYEISGVSADSDRFTDWYVHDVAGTMHYYDGMWYYNDINSNSIKCANTSGSLQKVVVDGTAVAGTVKIKGIEDGILYYYIGSKLCSQKL